MTVAVPPEEAPEGGTRHVFTLGSAGTLKTKAISSVSPALLHIVTRTPPLWTVSMDLNLAEETATTLLSSPSSATPPAVTGETVVSSQL